MNLLTITTVLIWMHYVANRARANWGKSLGKVKLVNNLNSFSKQTKNHLVAPSYPLVPFYPPAFSVPYIAASRDEYERKPVRVLRTAWLSSIFLTLFILQPPILFDVLSVSNGSAMRYAFLRSTLIVFYLACHHRFLH
jgi:hypothetical protein